MSLEANMDKKNQLLPLKTHITSHLRKISREIIMVTTFKDKIDVTQMIDHGAFDRYNDEAIEVIYQMTV